MTKSRSAKKRNTTKSSISTDNDNNSSISSEYYEDIADAQVCSQAAYDIPDDTSSEKLENATMENRDTHRRSVPD